MANVLIKILGIYLFFHAISSFSFALFLELFGFFFGMPPSTTKDSASSSSLTYPLAYGLGAIVAMAVCIVLIVKSRKIAEFLFKDDDE